MNYDELKPFLNDTRYQAVPVVVSRPCATFEPEKVAAAIRQAGHTVFMLHGAPDKGRSRYTYLVLNCQRRYELNGQELLTVTTDGSKTVHVADPAAALNAILEAHRTPILPQLPPFVGGLAGYFAYEYAQTVHKQLHLTPATAGGLPDVLLLDARQVLIHDNQEHTLSLSQIVPSTDLDVQQFEVVQQRLHAQITAVLTMQQQPANYGAFALTSELTPHFTPAEFAERVANAQVHIHAGDIFQLILANPQTATMRGSLLAAAPAVLAANPTPYQFYLGSGTREVLGASPELLVARHGAELQTFPLAGTRRRGKTPAEDAALAAELTHSPKELSEHNMLIDLGRNDLGAVSQLGSVHVTSVRQLLYFTSVMHMGSTVSSKIAPGVTPLDIVAALMPAGTLAGAPKLRAMEIIQELENARRGVYGGAVGYLGFDGNLELCIGIRLAQREGERLALHAGAGIVVDSVAKHEYQEFNNKIRGVKDALIAASGVQA